jgi:SAM-dependent methyltransferase
MHHTAYEIGALFFQAYGQPGTRVLDVGSYDVNGTLRPAAPAGCRYVGLDIAEGPGVDVVLTDPETFPFEDGSFDMVVSTSCFEHDPLYWLSFMEMVRVVRPGGTLYVNAPSNGVYHAFPLDCWRFYPDAGLALVRWARLRGHDLRLQESFIASRKHLGPDFNDCALIFSKGEIPAPPVRVAHQLPGCSNVRLGDNPDALLNPSVLNEDDRLLIARDEEIKALRARVAALEAQLVGAPVAGPG